MKADLFVEFDYAMRQKKGNEICGDVFLSNKIKTGKRTIVILSDGLGSGTKANILASMTASMAMNFVKANSRMEHTAKIILNTLPVDKDRKVSYSSFTIIDIEGDREVKLIEFGNPFALIWKDNSFFEPDKREISIKNKKIDQKMYTSSFNIGLNDSIIACSDGITQSGMGQENMPFGWGRDSLATFLKDYLEVEDRPNAGELSKIVISRAAENDNYKAHDDMSCGIINFKKPRKLLVCSGPPYNKDNDSELAKQIGEFSGNKLICGGTTAQIVSHEMNKEINMRIDLESAGLPPIAEMDGVDLVTEGILTIGKVSEILDNSEKLPKNISGPAGEIIKYFDANDEIEFLVGTRVNEAHQDPALPVELEIRRFVMKKIARLLESKFLKKVQIRFL